MAAGTSYAKRYGGGFLDLPTQTTGIDQLFLNAVETALLQLIGSAPTVDGQVAQWDNVNTRYGPALLLNKNVDPAAAIARTKLDFGAGLVNADIAAAAAIAYTKLNLSGSIVNADVATAAAIARNKLAAIPIGTTLPGGPADGDEAILVDSTTAPTFAMHFRFSTGVTTSKWIFIGGTPMTKGPLGLLTIATTVLTDLTSGPVGTIPGAGVWNMRWGANLENNAATLQQMQLTLVFSTAGIIGAGDHQQVQSAVQFIEDSGHYVAYGVTIAAAETFKLRCQNNSATSAIYRDGWVELTPVHLT